MARFNKLRIQDVKQETPDCISVELAIPEALQADYAYSQGQYLTIRTTVNGEELRRSYSICSSPHEPGLRIAVKKVEGGRMSTYLNERAAAGDELDVMTPMGNFFTKLDPTHAKEYVAVAAGSGITPIISILKATLKREPQSRFTLFYGNRDQVSVIFKIELEHLDHKYGDRLAVHYVFSRESTTDPLFEGRITRDKISELFDRYVKLAPTTEFFLCGPESMIFDTSDRLKEMGVDNSRIHVELFTSPVEGEMKTKSPADDEGSHKPAAKVADGQSAVTVILDDEEFNFGLAEDGDSVLDAALDHGVDVPFACKGAVCCTCRAKVLEGEVSMEQNFALTDAEVDQGYVLTCQSHPTSAKVVVSYDE